MNLVAEKPPRGWDANYYSRFRGRVDSLAARAHRASRDPAEESRRLQRLALVAEHGGEYADLLEHAQRPLVLDLSAEIPQPHAKRHPPSRQPRPRSGSLRASAGARLQRVTQTRRTSSQWDGKPRGVRATLRADGSGLFDVTDRHGQLLPNLALTAAGSLVEYVPKEREQPGELTARSVLRFGDLVVGFARELARR